MKPYDIDTIINQKRFRTSSSTLIAHDAFRDDRGSYEREGTNKFLYRTQRGAYWIVEQRGRGRAQCEELDVDGALNAYELLEVKAEPFGDAFPGVEVQTA